MKYAVLFMLLLALATGCDRNKPKGASEVVAHAEAAQLTAYAGDVEALIKFDQPVAGEKREFLIYLTGLSDSKPAGEGPLKLFFNPETGDPVEVTVAAPQRPGLYRAQATLPAPGEYTIGLLVQGKGVTHRVAIPHLEVLAKGESAKGHDHDGHAHSDEEEGSPAGGEKGAAAPPHGEGDGQKAGAGAEHHDEGEAHDDHEGHQHEKSAGAAHAGHDGHAHHPSENRVVVGTGGGTIALSKEQQWEIDFRSELPQRRDIATYFSAMGELVPVSNAEATVSAPLSGIVSVKSRLPFLGQKVSKGQVVALIEPPVRQEGGIGELSAAHAQGKTRVALAQKEYERARRLYEGKIAPLKRVEEAELELASAQGALEPLTKALRAVQGESGNGRIALRAPVSGTVVAVSAVQGQGVEAGQPIVRIINTGTLWLKANIPAVDAGKAALAAGATFTVTGVEGEFRPSRLVTVNDMLDPQTRTLPVIFEVPNSGARLKVGMFANVSLRTGEAKSALALPPEALVEDEGRWFVFVQTAGESFERREVKVGARDKGFVQILDGVKGEERVVTRGTYYVKLAAGAGKAADPHAGHGH